MKYQNVHIGKFIDRPNRFIANVLLDGKVETVHVKNTGRCKEILIPDALVVLTKQEGGNRKTKYDLIAAEKILPDGTKMLINIDSIAPNFVAGEFFNSSDLFSKNAKIKREVFYKKSRFDYYIEDENKKIFLEVKGVTLEKDGIALFPDAPTQRGVKHIYELIDATKNGYEAYILFILQLKGVKYFTPNIKTHPEFAAALKKAKEEGVHLLAFDCNVSYDTLEISKQIPIKL